MSSERAMLSEVGSVGEIALISSSSEYRWQVPNFTTECAKSVGAKVTSPAFSVGDSSDMSWKLELYPNGYNDSNAGNLVLLLCRSWSSVMVRFKFCIVDGRERVIHVHQSNAISLGRDGKIGAVMTRSSLLRERADEILVKGALTIVCEIIVDKEHDEREKLQSDCAQRQLSRYEGLIDNPMYSDFKFVVEGRQLHAHKVILETCDSAVFAAMLKHSMRESIDNTVVIEDAPYDVFVELIRFVYCGKVHDIDRIAEQLFVLADKYEFLELKDMCEDSLCESLNVERVIDYLTLADHHRAEKLRGRAISLVVENAKVVTRESEFKTVLRLSDSVSMEIIRRLADQAD